MSEHLDKSAKPEFRLFNLGVWNLYFILKVYFYFNGNLNFHLIENIAFFLLILVPLSSPTLLLLRKLSLPFIAAFLLYYDSWLPPIKHLFSQAQNLSGFDSEYIIELIGRLLTVELLSLFVIAILVYNMIKHHVRLSVISALLIGGVFYHQATLSLDITGQAFNQPAGAQGKIFSSITEQLDNFYQTESTRVVDYSNTELKAPFDILLLNICSLSWGDLRFTGLDNHPLLKRFDVLFSQFNSATSYSGPAAIRLLRASCGQSPHEALYQETNNQCYLADNLKKLGFTTQMAMNHDGKFDSFENYIRKEGKWNSNKIDVNYSPVSQRSFDGSPIYSDKAIFNLLLKSEYSPPKATYYNSVSLHDGNKIVGNRADLNSLENYRPRVVKMLNDLNYLFDSIEQSKRKVMVILVPEHGAGIEGDKLQISGMREFPAVDITNIPVGIKFFGLERESAATIEIDQPSSYLALSSLIQSVIAADIYGNDQAVDLLPLVGALPSTEYVSENESSMVGKYKNNYYLKIDQEDWMLYQQ
jgi:cellulose synthase operon protein YhjU